MKHAIGGLNTPSPAAPSADLARISRTPRGAIADWEEEHLLYTSPPAPDIRTWMHEWTGVVDARRDKQARRRLTSVLVYMWEGMDGMTLGDVWRRQ